MMPPMKIASFNINGIKARIEALTAFLATSPGGIDTVAIIALSGGADTPFVMSLQALRLLTVIATGPAIARFVARYAKPD